MRSQIQTNEKLNLKLNAEVSFELDENPGSKFSIDPVTGEILVVGSLDREEQDEYLLKVVARDGS